MARSHSTPADYAVNTMNGITFFDGLAQAMPHILAAPTYTPCFHFLLDVMNRTEATLLADVFYLSTLKGAVTEMVDGERHILCTTEFLAASKMRWSRQEQLYNFGTLEDKGFIRRVMHGMPSRRWIIIEWKAIADAIQKSGKPDGKASSKPDNQPSGKPDGKASSKPDRRRTVNRTETIVTASEDSKGNTVPNRPATSASPPQPPGIGTECESTTPTKERRGGSSPQQQATPAAVNKDIQCRSETEPTDDAYEEAFPLPPKTGKVTLSIPGMGRKTFDSMEEAKEYASRFKDTARSPEPPPSEPTTTPTRVKTGLLGDKEPVGIATEWANRLLALWHSKDMIRRKYRFSDWVRHIEEFRAERTTTDAEIEWVISVYEKNIHADHVPQAYSTKGFFDKYMQFLSFAKRMTNKRQKPTEDVIG